MNYLKLVISLKIKYEIFWVGFFFFLLFSSSPSLKNWSPRQGNWQNREESCSSKFFGTILSCRLIKAFLV